MATSKKSASKFGGISLALERVLHDAFVYARKFRHSYVTVEHLLLFLIDDPDARQALKACNVDIERLRKVLTEFVQENTPVEPADSGEEFDVAPTLGFQRVIQRAIMHVQASGSGDGQVTGANVLVAIFGEKDSHAMYYLKKEGVTRDDVANFVLHGTKKPVESVSFEERLEGLTTEIARPEVSDSINLNSAATGGSPRLRVFISYSHLDATCLDRLLVHLRPMNRAKQIDSWSDLQIRSGDKWREELKENLKTAAVAVLLISADFLASDFIVNDELPPLIVKAESEGLRLIPVVLKPCGYLRDPTLRNYQAINDPKEPLLGMPMIGQEFVYDKIASAIEEELKARIGK